MTTGWDRRDGSRRFQCNDTSSAFKGKVFCGRTPWPGAAAAPTVAVGAADFSYEVWLLRKVGNSPGSDVRFYSGICEDSGGGARPLAALDIDAEADDVTAVFDNFFSVFSPPTVLGIWSHYVINFDRDGNMELFIDVASKGTDDISGAASDLGSVEVHPLVGDFPTIASYGNPDNGDSFEDWDYAIMPVVVGPLAVHNRLLTTAEMEDSYRFRKVNNFGSSTTLVLYDWTVVDETGWDADLTHVVWGIRAAMALPIAMPEGTSARVLDKSGNENHWTLPTAASYGTLTGTWANVAFAADAFFRG